MEQLEVSVSLTFAYHSQAKVQVEETNQQITWMLHTFYKDPP